MSASLHVAAIRPIICRQVTASLRETPEYHSQLLEWLPQGGSFRTFAQPNDDSASASSLSRRTGSASRAASWTASATATRVRSSAIAASAPPSQRSGGGGQLSVRDMTKRLTQMEDWKQAVQSLRWMEEQLGHPPAAINYNIVLKMVASAGEWALAEELFQEMEGHPHTSGAQPDNFTFSTLISCCVRLGKHDLALQWIERMASRPQCIPDQVTYSTIINALSRCGEPQEALRVFQRMCDAGWEMDSATYGTVLTLFVNARKYHQALQLYFKLRHAGQVKLGEGAYNCVLVACRDQGMSDKALQIVTDMRASGVQPSVITHSLVLGSLAKSTDVETVLEYLRQVQDEGLRADSTMYNVVIGACRQLGRLGAARELFLEMEEEGVEASEATLRHKLAVLSELGDVEGVQNAQAALEQALGAPLDIQAYSNLIQGYARCGNPGALRGVVEQMRERGITADPQLTCILLSVMTQAVVASKQVEGRGRARDGGNAGCSMDDVLWCMEMLEAVECWELVSAVISAMDKGLPVSDIGRQSRQFLAGFNRRSRRVAANGLMDLLWAMGRGADARAVWDAASDLKVYHEKGHSSTADEGKLDSGVPPPDLGGAAAAGIKMTLPGGKTVQMPVHLDLRQMSVGAAHMALYEWLSRVEETAGEVRRLPRELVIAVGLGSFSRDGQSTGRTVRECIAETLARIGAPFAFSDGDTRLLTTTRENFAPFLATDWRSSFVDQSGELLGLKLLGSDPVPRSVGSPSGSSWQSMAGTQPADGVKVLEELLGEIGPREEAEDNRYWVMDGFAGWTSEEGWVKMCRCGKVWSSRKRRCVCGLDLPQQRAIKSKGFLLIPPTA